MRQVPGVDLWIGNVGDVRRPRDLVELGILAVIDLAMDEPPAVVTRETVYCRFPLIDSAGNPPWLLGAAIDTLTRLLHARIRTLVYCSNGLSRSPCIAAAAIGRFSNCSVRAALDLVARAGPADLSPGLWSDVLAVA